MTIVNEEIVDFWKTEGLDHIIPPSQTNHDDLSEEFVEGFDPTVILADIVQNETVADIGCGYGRLSHGFKDVNYVGYDINEVAIKQAKERHPNHTYKLMPNGYEIDPSDWVLFYTVLLHIPDTNINDFILRTTRNCNNVVISEILGRKWRRDGNPPVFNRHISEYIHIMNESGFYLTDVKEHEYRHYKNTNITFLVFKRKEWLEI